MPITPADAHLDARLTDIATAYHNGGFIADEISPVILVDKASDKYTTRNRKDVSTIQDDRIGARSASNEVSYDVSTDSYLVEDRGLHGVVPRKLFTNADAPIQPDEWATANVMQKLMLAREKRVADLVMTQGNWAAANTAAVTNYWSNETSGTPLDDINTGLEAIPSTGEDSRLIFVCSLPVWNKLRKHPQLMGLRPGGGTSGGMLAPQEFAEYLGVDAVFVSKAFVNSANVGQTASYGRVWGATTAALLMVPSVVAGPDIELFTATFREKPGIEVRRWHDPAQGKGGSDVVQIEFSDDEKVVQNDKGYLFRGVLA